jgi:hypothetical protein
MTPDMTLINELWDFISRNHPAIQARVLLMQQWIDVGWLDAARDTAQELLRYDPANPEARQFLQEGGSPQGPTSSNSTSVRLSGAPHFRPRRGTPQLLHLPRTPDERVALERELTREYDAVRDRAEILLRETRLVSGLQGKPLPDSHAAIQDLQDLANGNISSIVSKSPPRSVRAVAKAAEANRSKALDVIVEDLAYVVFWLRSSSSTIVDNDSVRETLVKRIRLLTAALSDDLHSLPQVALMHIEHEELEHTYINSITMYGDDVSDIPRANFWASEDGHAWDMEELAAALASNGGVMRNPLSRQMFTADDVRAIIAHPQGNRLAAMQVAQDELSKGVRPRTIDQLDQLSAALLTDQSDDQLSSRCALDSFLRYSVTLPPAEQRALDELRVPAVDSHTGIPFDCSIGEAVRDAQANRICLHKAGDLIRQAARHLRQIQNSGSA